MPQQHHSEKRLKGTTATRILRQSQKQKRLQTFSQASAESNHVHHESVLSSTKTSSMQTNLTRRLPPIKALNANALDDQRKSKKLPLSTRPLSAAAWCPLTSRWCLECEAQARNKHHVSQSSWTSSKPYAFVHAGHLRFRLYVLV